MSAQTSPSLYVDNIREWETFVSADRRIAQDLRTRVVDRGVILPLQAAPSGGAQQWVGGVADRGGNWVAGHLSHRKPDAAAKNVVAGYELPSEVPHIPESVVYGGGRDVRHFGHFLTESLSRLWWLAENRDRRYKVAFIDPGLGKSQGGLQLLERLGLAEEDIVLVDRPTRFNEVIVPDQASYLISGEMHPRGASAIYDAIRDSVEPGTVEKVYLTRTALKWKAARTREIGEVFLEDFFKAQGYEVVAPETLSLVEQISLLAGAKEIASTAGTLSHLVVFCQNHVRQTVIVRDKHPTLPIQWSMSGMREATLSIVDPTIGFMPGSHTAGVVYFTATSQWARYAKEQFGVEADVANPRDYLLDYLAEWADLVATTGASQLHRYPDWTVADLVIAVKERLVGSPLTPAAVRRLRSHFDSRRRQLRSSQMREWDLQRKTWAEKDAAWRRRREKWLAREETLVQRIAQLEAAGRHLRAQLHTAQHPTARQLLRMLASKLTPAPVKRWLRSRRR